MFGNNTQVLHPCYTYCKCSCYEFSQNWKTLHMIIYKCIWNVCEYFFNNCVWSVLLFTAYDDVVHKMKRNELVTLNDIKSSDAAKGKQSVNFWFKKFNEMLLKYS